MKTGLAPALVPNADLAAVPDEARTALARYEVMRAAIRECASLDVAKEMQSQAGALAVYYRQATDTESEYLMREIRIRAQRRAGEILDGMKRNGMRRSEGGKVGPKTPLRPTLAALGIPSPDASLWQAMARVPEPVFEKHLQDVRENHQRPMPYKIAALARASIPRERTPRTRQARAIAHDFLAALRLLSAIDLDPVQIPQQFAPAERASMEPDLDKVLALLDAVRRAWRNEA